MSPREREIALQWVAHVRECVAMGVAVEALKAKLSVTLLYIRGLRT